MQVRFSQVRSVSGCTRHDQRSCWIVPNMAISNWSKVRSKAYKLLWIELVISTKDLWSSVRYWNSLMSSQIYCSRMQWVISTLLCNRNHCEWNINLPMTSVTPFSSLRTTFRTSKVLWVQELPTKLNLLPLGKSVLTSFKCRLFKLHRSWCVRLLSDLNVSKQDYASC